MFLYVFFLYFASRQSNIEQISQYLSICKSVLVTHPSQPDILLFCFSTLRNIHTYVHMSLTYYKRLNEGIISVNTESMTSNFWPNTYFQCSTTCKNNFRQNWINGGFCPNTYNFPLNEQFPIAASLFDLFHSPHYMISQTAVLSELVIDWIIIIGCVESCQREIGCWYLLSRLKIQLFENVT